MNCIVMGVASALLASASATGATPTDYGYDLIKAKQLAAAETELHTRRAKEPDEPSVLINLAYVYAKTGRAADAATLYERVLALPDVLLALGNGKPRWSHALANKGLGRPEGVALTSQRP